MRTGRRDKNRIADNRGVSLVELIVVISIMAVLAGVLSYSLTMMFSRDANYVAVRIDDMLTEARTLSMSKEGTFTYVLHIDSSGTYTGSYTRIDFTDAGGTTTEYKKVLLDKSVTIVPAGVTVDAAGDIKVVFDKAKGNVTLINGARPASGAVYTFTVTSRKNTSKTRVVTLVPTTGRHYTDK